MPFLLLPKLQVDEDNISSTGSFKSLQSTDYKLNAFNFDVLLDDWIWDYNNTLHYIIEILSRFDVVTSETKNQKPLSILQRP